MMAVNAAGGGGADHTDWKLRQIKSLSKFAVIILMYVRNDR
jgi:hypothetical protein